MREDRIQWLKKLASQWGWDQLVIDSDLALQGNPHGVVAINALETLLCGDPEITEDVKAITEAAEGYPKAYTLLRELRHGGRLHVDAVSFDVMFNHSISHWDTCHGWQSADEDVALRLDIKHARALLSFWEYGVRPTPRMAKAIAAAFTEVMKQEVDGAYTIRGIEVIEP